MSQTARLLSGAGVVLLLLHLAAVALDADFRSIQGMGGLWGVPRLLAPPIVLVAYLLNASALSREVRRSPVARLARVGAPVGIAGLFGLLLVPAVDHPYIAAFEATICWVGIALAAQPLNLNAVLRGSRLARLGAIPVVILGLSLPWLVHFAVFEFTRSRCVALLDSAEALWQGAAFSDSLTALDDAVERCAVPRRREQVGQMREELFTRWEQATLEEARRLLGSGDAEGTEKLLLAFLSNDVGTHAAAPTALLDEARVTIGEQMLAAVDATRRGGRLDDALDQVRAFLERLPGHPRRAEGVEIEAEIERDAAGAAASRVRDTLQADADAALALARAAEPRYPDEYASSDLPALRTAAADIGLERKLVAAQTEEDFERYDAALALLDPLTAAYPEAPSIGTVAVRTGLIRGLARDPGQTLLRSFWFRKLSPVTAFGRSPEWLLERLPDLALRKPTTNKLLNELLPFCRDVAAGGSPLYTSCFSAWNGKLMELYIHFAPGTNMQEVIDALIPQFGPPDPKVHVVSYWTRSGYALEVQASKQVLTWYNLGLKNKYEKRRKRL